MLHFFRKTAFALLLLTPLLTAAPLFVAPSGHAAERASAISPREALRKAEKGLQTEMPAKTNMREENLEPLKLPDLPDTDLSMTQRTMRMLLYGAIIVILVVILLNLRGNLWSESRSRRLIRTEEEAVSTAAVERMDKAQHAADELAAAGNYAEAMHLLLLQSVNELRLRLDISIASSLTSREIARQVELSEHGRAMFMDLVHRVEVTYFGSHLAGPDDYWACRNSYEEMAASLLELINRQAGYASDLGVQPGEGGQSGAEAPGRRSANSAPEADIKADSGTIAQADGGQRI